MSLPAGVYVIKSESSDQTYDLTIKKSGRGIMVSCSCLGFRYRQKCKHATAAKNGEYAA